MKEKETLEEYYLTAEEFFRNKIKEVNPLATSITLSTIGMTAEKAMRWAKEYADYFAKWQQERMYSEEEVLELCESIKHNERQWDLFDKGVIKTKPKSYQDIIEQFKKK